MPSNSKSQVGARSELIACAWLIENGYAVFRNVSNFGPVDIIALRGQTLLRLDIKTANKHEPKLREWQVKEGIIALYVYPDGTCRIEENPNPQLPDKLCIKCGNSFTPKLKAQKFCADPCRWESPSRVHLADCVRCSKSFLKSHKRQKFCSIECRTANFHDQNPNYASDYREKLKIAARAGAVV